MLTRICTSLVAAVLLATLAVGCGGDDALPPVQDRDAAWKTLGLNGTEAALQERLTGLSDVVLAPPAVPGEGYAPSFPDDLPFDPSAWTTNAPAPSIADPRATRGGTLRLAISSFPPTVRTEGPNSRLSTLSDIQNLIYEPLLGLDIASASYEPYLASHWSISDDKKTFRFRIDPEARWADGSPVTADDVAATFEHLTNPDRKDPTVAKHWQEIIEGITVLDRLTVEIRTNEARWRSFLAVSNQFIYPAAYIRMDGETYLTDWNWKLPPGTGPYELRSDDIKKGQSITVRRRRDYWQDDRPHRRGTYNFAAVAWKVIRSRELMYQKFLADEIDLYLVYAAQRWVDESNREPSVQNGWVQKRKIYNRVANGYGGYCFNMRSAPFSSLNVRKAFAHLFNREKLFAKYFFYQYEYKASYFPGSPNARPGAQRVRFDPDEALRLLGLDGWDGRDDQGYLVHRETGERFPTLTLDTPDPSPASQRIQRLVADDLWNYAGIKMEPVIISYSSFLKKVWDWKFKIISWGWTASHFPDPEFQFHSKFAQEKQSNNLNGFENEEADRIMDAYRFEFDGAKRRGMLQRLDEIIFEQHPYALNWYAPYFRTLYWDRFGHPREYASQFARDINNITTFWWHDPERDALMKRNRSAGTPSYPEQALNQYDPPEQTYWLKNDAPMPRTGSE